MLIRDERARPVLRLTLICFCALAGLAVLRISGSQADDRKAADSLKIPRVDEVQAPRNAATGFARVPRRVDRDLGALAEPAPKEIAVRVTGKAVDTSGRAVKGATIYLLNAWMKSQIVASTTTDAAGEYVVATTKMPVSDGTFNGQKRPNIAPFATFQVVGTAPRYGITWHQQDSMYAVREPDPTDIQGRRPLGALVAMNLTFRPADSLHGRVVDEKGRAVPGVKLAVQDADLLDSDGLETSRNSSFAWDVLPGGRGQAVTDAHGRFTIDGLPSEGCFWVFVKRSEFPSFGDALYAATIEKPVAEHGQPRRHSGRQPHKVYSGDIRLTLPTPRRLRVRVVADDTGKPLAGVRVSSLGEAMATGVFSGGTSDAEGRLTLDLPPGHYRGVVGDPPIDTHYIRTYRRDLTVADEPTEQSLQLRMSPGCELLVDAIDFSTGKGLPDVLFWLAPTDHPEAKEQIQASTFQSAAPWTDEAGRMRAVLPPKPGKQYRLRFAGLHLPNSPGYFLGPEKEQPQFDIVPAESEPFSLEAGKTVHVRFELLEKGK